MIIAQINFIRNFTIMQNLKRGMHKMCSFKIRYVHYTNILTDLESMCLNNPKVQVTHNKSMYKMYVHKHSQVTCT